jgi:hypothetical protein
MKADERRFTPRYNLKIPLKIQSLDASYALAQAAESANISARGVYFASDLPFKIGTPLQIALRMPEEVTGKASPEWNCRGRVVRVDVSRDSTKLDGNRLRNSLLRNITLRMRLRSDSISA